MNSMLVTVGTDHHPFTRLLDWVDQWLGENPQLVKRCVVQHGQSKPTRSAENHSLISFEQLSQLMRESSIVVSHGGVSTLFEARDQGRLPICVPRSPEFGEHVDDHQIRVARLLREQGLVDLAETYAEFARLVHSRLDSPEAGVVEPDREERTAPAIQRLGQVVDEAVASKPRRLPQLLNARSRRWSLR